MARSPTAKSRKEVQTSLIAQLEKMGANGDHYMSLVGDYMRWWDIHRKLQKDIALRGATVWRTMTGGAERLEVNPSIKAAREASQHMLAILRELGLSPGHGAEIEPEIPEL